MTVEHLTQIGSAVKLPFFVCTPPVENVGTHLTADMFMQLVDRLKNLRGIVDSGNIWATHLGFLNDLSEGRVALRDDERSRRVAAR